MRSISLYEFGGSEELLCRVQEPLVEMFKGFDPVLDIGCGRGVFLELLRRANIAAIGIDHSEEAIAACEKKGVEVQHEEARGFLARNPCKFGGIFCSHVVEHMAYADALNFLDLCKAALRPGGILLIITPNPADLSVISEVFWMDPTHIRPYPKLLLRSMLEAVGFQVTLEKQFLGSWRMVGRRGLPAYFFRRMLLGRYFGKPNTLVLGRNPNSGQN
jgi:2-polyprenyl-3-methyl-5-hydroxy-6-metoxy-1,4-benzoquinol methylase